MTSECFLLELQLAINQLSLQGSEFAQLEGA